MQFCTQCSNLLDYPGDEMIVTCNTCGSSQNASSIIFLKKPFMMNSFWEYWNCIRKQTWYFHSFTKKGRIFCFIKTRSFSKFFSFGFLISNFRLKKSVQNAVIQKWIFIQCNWDLLMKVKQFSTLVQNARKQWFYFLISRYKYSINS